MKTFYTFFISMLSIAFLLITGCTVSIPDGQVVYKLPSSAYPDFEDDMMFDGLEHSIMQSLTYLERISPDREFQFGEDRYTTAHMIRSLEFFREYIKNRPSKKELKDFIKSNYILYKSTGRNKKGEVLFTGYYEPFLQGRTKRDNEYKYPIWTLPNDIITIDLSKFSSKYKGQKVTGRYTGKTVLPYYDRKEIEQDQVLQGKAENLAWINDPVALFFLQIQGSGRVYLDNGKAINVHYHGSNGRPYRSIGNLLIKDNKIASSEMSMQKIREYLADHPEEVDDILNYNESYVFFKTEEEGPLGCLNVKLTPGRSIALDRRIFPLPALAFINSKKPLVTGESTITQWTEFNRFVCAQDTGGAIQGPGRADLFWGNGAYAETAAGHMKHTGNLYLLMLKPE